MALPTNRNIVKVLYLGATADITYGPSDDDFHYQCHHDAITHDEPTNASQPFMVKVISMEGGAEVQWGNGDSDTELVGVLMVSREKGLTARATAEDGTPLVVHLDTAGRLRVSASEDQPPNYSADDPPLFDSLTPIPGLE